MKKYILLIFVGLLGVSCSVSAKNCDDALILRLLEDILNNSNIIKPKTIDIQEVVNNLSNDETTILETISENDEIINSKLDDIAACCTSSTDVLVLSQLDVIESLVENIAVSGSDELILSQLDIIEGCCASSSDVLDTLSQNDELILSQLDVIESTVDSNAACCASSSDVLGELTDIGSCLDSAIDVPDDINNLTLTVIALLKTILLDLRGCNIP